MIFFRRRLFFWLLKAYIKKWGKRFFFFFLIGLAIFFILIHYASSFINKIPSSSRQSIGIVGDYKLENLPRLVLTDLSKGLTDVAEDGSIHPAAAKSWKILDNGKTYEFTLNTNYRFTDGTKLRSNTIEYNFTDAKIEHPNDSTLIFKLKDTYSPFLVSVSRPIFKNGLVGIGEYKIKSVDLNGEFVKSVQLVSTKNSLKTITYHFYPSHDALKLAFLLGEVNNAQGLPDISYKTTSFKYFPTISTQQTVNYSRLVTLFFNTKDATLSDEKLRNALTYALPDNFSQGKRNTTPFSPTSWLYADNPATQRVQDIEHAQNLLKSSSATQSASLKLTIKVFPKYKKTAEEIAKQWEIINIKPKIEEVNSVPSDFQMFLGDFLLSKDPDQYTLWHSAQVQNISHYQSLRIDKLLEDGRKTTDIEKRRKIYEEFQKYLLADSPAAFLYFPYEYDLTRK